ncbi:hypothetical protein FEM48_Zijuj06G0145800 [Ziziphus jujuba var. spinosa]|uniref:Uncharacterized protein n=1 Tax=Ziziphus jujuba var. spinosa TaxID=714518 RepID=A0A978V9U9_ZIZJJ|nr:hypothetical protein FEM48_Zijuj06G0145800 [Ziziphus jujuba var. spinosa]
MESSDGVNIESPYVSLANSMRDQFDSLPPISSACTLYRVPDRLRLVKEEAYIPQVVSIGPLHHGKDSLKAMEEHKMRYRWKYLERTRESLENYLKIVKESEPKLRSSYAESIGFSSDEFVQIILVDSVFIIEELRDSFPVPEDEPDWIFNKPWMLHDVRLDLLMLENQFPFFILEKLYTPNKITLSSGQTVNLSIIELSHKFFTKQIPLEGTEEKFEKIKGDNVAHFVDFLRKLYIPSNPRNGEECKSVTASSITELHLTIPSVTELHRAGVKFKVASSKNLFDINFKNGNGILEQQAMR